MSPSRVGQWRRATAIAIGLTLSALPAAAASPDATRIMRGVKTALEPARPSIRQMTLTVSAGDGEEASRWTVGQARRHFPDGDRMVTVILSPADTRGIALLMREPPGAAAVEQSIWLPAVRRVRTLVMLEGVRPFLESDFTLADLGFVSLQSRFTFAGTGTHDGVPAYDVVEVPGAPIARWHYSKILNWVAQATGFPLERDFYDPSGALWKTEHFRDVSTVDGVPTVLDLRMIDEQSGGQSELHVDDVRYDVDLPDELFERAHLRGAAEAPIWSSVRAGLHSTGDRG
jgi:hypothetical protein